MAKTAYSASQPASQLPAGGTSLAAKSPRPPDELRAGILSEQLIRGNYAACKATRLRSGAVVFTTTLARDVALPKALFNDDELRAAIVKLLATTRMPTGARELGVSDGAARRLRKWLISRGLAQPGGRGAQTIVDVPVATVTEAFKRWK